MVFYVQGIRVINGGGGKLHGPDFSIRAGWLENSVS